MPNSSKLKIVIEVDDKGSLKINKLGKTAEQAGDRGAKGFRKMRRSLNDLDKSSKVTLGTMRNITLAGAAMAAGVTALLVKAVNEASELHETTGKFSVVYGAMTKQADAWAKNLVANYAMSENEAKKYLASTQDILVPMGMVPEAAGKISNAVAKLAADLGSFNDMPTAQVMNDIQSALVGNYETMKKYGDVLTATSIQQKALDMGLAKNVKSLTAGMKAQAAFQLILHGSAAAIGDMSRTANGYANRMKKFHSIITDLFAGLGEHLLPLAAKGIGQINDELGGTTDQVDALSRALSMRLIGSLENVLSVMRFFQNFWYGLKLVAAGAIDFIAAGLERLFRLLRALMIPADKIFQSLVKLGMIDVNPFDSITTGLDDFAWSSHNVTKDVLADIDKTNTAYNKMAAAIKGYKKELLSGQKAAAAVGKGVNNNLHTQKTLLEQIGAGVSTVGRTYMVEQAAWMEGTDALARNILDTSDLQKQTTDSTAQYIEDRWKEAYDGIQDSLASWIENGKISFDSLLSMFKHMLAEMVAAWLMNMARMKIGEWLSGSGGWLGELGTFMQGGGYGGGGGGGGGYRSFATAAAGHAAKGWVLQHSSPAVAKGLSTVGNVIGLAGGAYGMYSGVHDMTHGHPVVGGVETGVGAYAAYNSAVDLGLIESGSATSLIGAGGSTVAPYVAGGGQALGSTVAAGSGTTVVAGSGSTVVVSGTTATGAAAGTTTAAGSSTAGAAGSSAAGWGAGAAAAAWMMFGTLVTQTRPLQYRHYNTPMGDWAAVKHLGGQGAHFDALQGLADQSQMAMSGVINITESIKHFQQGVSVLTTQFHDGFGQMYKDVQTGKTSFAALAETMAKASGTMIDVTHDQEQSMRDLAEQASGGSTDALRQLSDMLHHFGIVGQNANVAAMAMVSSITGVSASMANASTSMQQSAASILHLGSTTRHDIRYYQPLVAPKTDFIDLSKFTPHADGGIFSDQVHLFGEAGPEAVVPLHSGPDTLKKMDAKIDALRAQSVTLYNTTQIMLDGEVLDSRTERTVHQVVEDRNRSGIERVLI